MTPNAATIEPHPAPAPALTAAVSASSGERVLSVDALRGLDMACIVGGTGLVYALAEMSSNPVTRTLKTHFTHVQWEGLHFYDLIYPLFLFLVGVSIVFSLEKAIPTERRSAIIGRILRRGLLLWAFGFIYNGGFTTRWPDLRMTSVLGLIGASYVLAALIYLQFGRKLRTLSGITAGLLLGSWELLAFVPFPDIRLDKATVAALAAKAGSSSPAVVSAFVPQRVAGVYEEGYNFSSWMDYRFLPGKKANGHFENMGLLSPLTGAAICLMGAFAGRLLQNRDVEPRRKVKWLLVAGIPAIGLGWLWGLDYPVVKKIWTSSYCLVAAGYSAVFLAIFYLVIDIWGFRKWCQPFVWIGVNAITIYMVVSLAGSGGGKLAKMAERFVGGDIQAAFDRITPGLGQVVIHLGGLVLVLLLARFLHHRKIFLRL